MDDGDDLFITESFQPEEENSSVVGNSSMSVWSAEPSSIKEELGNTSDYSSSPEQTKEEKERRVSAPLSRLKAAPILHRLSLPGKLKGAKDHVSKLSRLAEDTPWAFPGSDNVSKVAVNTLDDGDDLFLSDSFLPSEENSSVVGNSSVHLFEEIQNPPSPVLNEDSADDTNDANVILDTDINGAEQINSIIRKFSISKDQVFKLTEDVPFALPGKDPVSRLANDTLDDGDDLFISESFQECDDVSSVIGNSSVVEPQHSTAHSMEATFKTSPPLQSSTSADKTQSKLTSPIIRKLPQAAGKIRREMIRSTQMTKNLSGKMMRSSQRFLPSWRPNSLRTRQYRSVIPSEYQEMTDEMNGNCDDRTAASFRATQDYPRYRLERQDSTCSELSDITEPSTFSRSRSFRNSRSMFILPPEASLLGEVMSDEVSEEESALFSRKEEGKAKHVFLATELKGSVLPDIMETKPFTVMNSNDILAPEVVNGFLNQIGEIEKTDESWDLFSTLSNDDWRISTPRELDDEIRQRVHSDSDVVFEFQRQRLKRQESDVSDDPQVIASPDRPHDCSESRTRTNDAMSETTTDLLIEIKSMKRSASAEQLPVGSDHEFEHFPSRTRFFSDSEYKVTSKETGALETPSLLIQIDDLERSGKQSMSRSSPQQRSNSWKNASLSWSLHSKKASTLQKWTMKSTEQVAPTKKSYPGNQKDDNSMATRTIQQLSSMSPATALNAAKMMAQNYTRSQEYYWNLSSESDEGNSPSAKEEVLFFSDDSIEDIL